MIVHWLHLGTALNLTDQYVLRNRLQHRDSCVVFCFENSFLRTALLLKKIADLCIQIFVGYRTPSLSHSTRSSMWLLLVAPNFYISQ